MRLTTEQILTIQNIKGFGNASVNTISHGLSIISTNAFNDLFRNLSLKELHEVIVSLQKEGKLSRKNVLEIDELLNANRKAKGILDISHSLKISCISRDGLDRYPRKLEKTIDENGKASVPEMIFAKCNNSFNNILDTPAVAIIGTRNPTTAGINAGQYFGKHFASKGFNVVSGLALGCDTAAHQGALFVKDGITTAVLAGGLDSIYPKENSELADKIIAKNGILISENPVGTATDKYNLVARDRLQAALADVVVVIQTSINGGTMHAVRAAMVAGKKVYCVKFSNEEDITDGARYLIDHGAEWIRNEEDIEKIIENLSTDIPEYKEYFERVKLKLIADIQASYLSSFRNDWKYYFTYDYYSKRVYPIGSLSKQDEINRQRIWDFKNGSWKIGFKFISNFIITHFTNEQLADLTLCVIPASTKDNNKIRYEKMCEELSAKYGIKNGYSLITILRDRETSHIHGKSDNTIKDLSFSPDIKGRKILLFDDITTRGLTFIQHAGMLRKMGAESIVGLFMGKTVENTD